MARFVSLTAALVLAGCSQDSPPPAPPTGVSPAQGPGSIEATAAPVPAPARVSRYAALKDCRVVREDRTEMPYTESRCDGPAGWALRIADSDARQSLAVIAPGGSETRLDLSRVSGGAFNSFIGNVEWRGPRGEAFEPDALILRYSVAEEPYPAPEVSLLLAIRLAPVPCLVAIVRPGPQQNGDARVAADGPGPCIAAR